MTVNTGARFDLAQEEYKFSAASHEVRLIDFCTSCKLHNTVSLETICLSGIVV